MSNSVQDSIQLNNSDAPSNKVPLSIEDCRDILFKDLKHKDFSIKSFNVSSLSDNIEGFLGEHFVVIIEYDLLQEPSCHCKNRYFMKVVSSASPVVMEMTTSLNAFAKEEFFYNFLLGELSKNNRDISFAPKSYICKSDIIVLEDLSVRDYKTVPKNTFFDIFHFKQALIALAKLHSSSIAYEAQMKNSSQSSKLLQKYPEMFRNIFANKSSIVKKWFEHTLEGIIQIIGYIYDKDVRKNEIIDKLKNFAENSHTVLSNMNKHKCTVLHGDVWLNNFLFKYQDGAPTDCVLIDYQIINYGPPSLEVLHLLYCTTRKKFRNDHFNELIEFYYETLEKYLAKYNISGFLPKEEYLRLCEVYKLWIKLQCICDRCVTFMPDKYVHERVANDDDLRKYLFEDRAEVMLTCFKEEESFRHLISEDLEELIELLLKNYR